MTNLEMRIWKWLWERRDDPIGHGPTVRQIAAAVGNPNPGTVHHMLKTMRFMGVITYVDGKRGSIRALPLATDQEAMHVPKAAFDKGVGLHLYSTASLRAELERRGAHHV